jgi:hypothetical protein
MSVTLPLWLPMALKPEISSAMSPSAPNRPMKVPTNPMPTSAPLRKAGKDKDSL